MPPPRPISRPAAAKWSGRNLPFTSDNFDSNLAKIKESGANAVLITLVGGASVGFNRAFGSFGLSDHVIRLGTLIEENTLAGIGADGSKNLFASAGYFASVATPAAKAFAEAYAGLAPSPWQSGNVNREQGVSKAGNPRLRATMVELAWLGPRTGR